MLGWFCRKGEERWAEEVKAEVMLICIERGTGRTKNVFITTSGFTFTIHLWSALASIGQSYGGEGENSGSSNGRNMFFMREWRLISDLMLELLGSKQEAPMS